MRNSRNTYLVPSTEIIDIQMDKFMIEIGSGETSPEESDTNRNFFEEEDEVIFRGSRNLWDD